MGLTIYGFFKGVSLLVKAIVTNAYVQAAFYIATFAVGVKGYLQPREMLAKGQDIMANKTAAGGKLPVVYGNRRVGAQVVYMDTASNNSTHLYVVYALSVGEVEEINLIFTLISFESFSLLNF